MRFTRDNHPLNKLSGSPPVISLSPKTIRELASDETPPVAEDNNICGTDTNSDTDDDGPIAAYVVYYGRKMGVYRDWADVEKNTEGFDDNTYRGFPTITSARDSWSQKLANGTWGLLQALDTENDESEQSSEDSSGPIVTPIPIHATPRKTTTRGVVTNQPPRTTMKPTHSAPSRAKQNASVPQHTATPCNSPTQKRKQKVTTKGLEQYPRPRFCVYDEVYYAVLSGRAPGVYLGRDEAARAAGTNGRAIIYRATSKANADATFSKAYMNEGVVIWDVNGGGRIHASAL